MPIQHVTILGAGTMGHGIAQVTATVGLNTTLYDISPELVETGRNKIKSILESLVQKGKLPENQMKDILSKIRTSSELGSAVEKSDLVIEAVPERMDIKVGLFRSVLENVSDQTLLASNTSSLSITELGQSIGAPERTLGLHFFNPPPVMELVEVVRGMGTSEASLEQALAFVRELRKTPIVIRDFPGFATSRLGVILGAEAIRMVEQGVAGVEEIDKAMELGYRHPMGPLKLTDLVGLDVRLAILDHLHKELGEQFRPPSLLRQMVRAGRVGKKVGLGFYRWEKDGPKPA
jgi:3-hydroxybutyryl-CoA dehydrogenase